MTHSWKSLRPVYRVPVVIIVALAIYYVVGLLNDTVMEPANMRAFRLWLESWLHVKLGSDVPRP
jgi:hypothetical protein